MGAFCAVLAIVLAPVCEPVEPDPPTPTPVRSSALTRPLDAPVSMPVDPLTWSPYINPAVPVTLDDELVMLAALAVTPVPVIETPPPNTTPEPEVARAPDKNSAPITLRTVWDDLADCESGNWINGGASFEVGSARWDMAKPGVPIPSWATTIHHGGLQFHPGTWSAFKDDSHPEFAYDATREQQIEVGERVLAAQGWQAWPACTKRMGLR